MTVEVRRLVPDDWATLEGVRLRMLLDSPSSFATTYEEESSIGPEARRETIAARAWFVALDGTDTVGVACGGELRDPDPAYRALRSMWVAPSHRGTGVADALVEAVARWAREDGASRLSLWAFEGATRAAAFYVRCGFRATEEVAEVHGRPHVAMTRYELALE